MTFLIDRDGMRRHGSRRLTPDVGVMGPIGHPGDVSRGHEDRGDESEIVEMGATKERVIDRVLDTRDWLESGQAGRHRFGHRPEMNGDVLCLGQHLAVGGEHGGRAVGPLLDVGRKRRMPQDRAHLVCHRGRDDDGPPRGRSDRQSRWEQIADVLRGLPVGQTGELISMLDHETRHAVGVDSGILAKRPADRLANEEFLLERPRLAET